MNPITPAREYASRLQASMNKPMPKRLNARIQRVLARNADKLANFAISDNLKYEAECRAIYAEAAIISAALDEILLNTVNGQATSFVLYGQRVILVRGRGLSYNLYSEVGKWASISELAGAAAEYAFMRGYIRPLYQ